MDVLGLLQWPGMALGLLGAPLVAGKSARIRRIGFAVWIGSNIAWIIWSLHTQAWGLLAMQSVFCVTSLMGWANNRNEPVQNTTIACQRQPGNLASTP